MANVIEDQLTTPSSHFIEPASPQMGDHEQLFRLLEDVGPAPDQFMVFLSDPVLGRENVFEDIADEEDA